MWPVAYSALTPKVCVTERHRERNNERERGKERGSLFVIVVIGCASTRVSAHL